MRAAPDFLGKVRPSGRNNVRDLTPVQPGSLPGINEYLLPAGMQPLGPKTTERAASVVFGGARDLGRISTLLGEVLGGRADYYVAQAGIPNADGEVVERAHWLTALIDGERVREVAKRVPNHAIADRLAGVGNGTILRCVTSVYCEIDDVPIHEQIARYTEIEEATGLRWALWVHSGNKSVHAYIATERTTTRDQCWTQAQEYLAALVGGDPAVASSGRRMMRLPGFESTLPDGRKQPVLLLRDGTNGGERYEPRDVRDRLRALYERRGGRDVEKTLDAIALVARLRRERRGEGLAQEIARQLYEERFAPDASLVFAAESARDGAYEGDGGFREGGFDLAPHGRHGRSTDGKPIVYMPAEALSAFRGAWMGSRVDPPCGGPEGHGRRDNGQVQHRPGESPRIYCHACRHVLLVEGDEWRGSVPRAIRLAEEAEVARIEEERESGTVTVVEVVAATERDRREQEAAKVDLALSILHGAPAPDADEKLRSHIHEEYAERRERKRAAAIEIDPRREAAATRAIVEGGRYRARIERELRAQGLTHESETCRFRLGLTSAATRSIVVVAKECKKLSCPHCMSTVISDKLGAALVGAVTDKAGKVVGHGLATRDVVYRYETDESGLSAWVETRKKRIKRDVPFSRMRGTVGGYTGKRDVAVRDTVYVAFSFGGRVTILSDLPPTSRGLQPTATYSTPAETTDAAVTLTISTYRLVSADLDDATEKSLAGSITSSNNLHLDPEKLRADANPADWYVAVRHPRAASDAKAKLSKLGIAAKTKEGDSDSLDTGNLARIAQAQGKSPIEVFEEVKAALTDENSNLTREMYEDPNVDEVFGEEKRTETIAMLAAIESELSN